MSRDQRWQLWLWCALRTLKGQRPLSLSVRLLCCLHPRGILLSAALSSSLLRDSPSDLISILPALLCSFAGPALLASFPQCLVLLTVPSLLVSTTLVLIFLKFSFLSFLPFIAGSSVAVKCSCPQEEQTDQTRFARSLLCS